MRSLTLAVVFTLFERGLVTANYYNLIAQGSYIKGAVRRISWQTVELSPLMNKPTVLVATLGATSQDRGAAARFWLEGGTLEAILPSGTRIHAGFDANEPAESSYTPIYFAKKTVTVEDTVTEVQGHTMIHAKGFSSDDHPGSGVSRLAYKRNEDKFAFCPSPHGDTVVTSGKAYENRNGDVLILSILKQGFPHSSEAGCIPTFVFAKEMEMAGSAREDDQ